MLGKLTLTAVLLVTIAGCHRAPYNEAEVRKLTMPSLHPSPAYTQPPTYLAANYGKRGQPRLTPREIRLIRKTLAVIKPCQRSLLRYAFVSDPSVLGTRVALFFAKPGEPIFDAHVLRSNLVYNEGRAFAVPAPKIPSDIRIDIAETPCENEENN